MKITLRKLVLLTCLAVVGCGGGGGGGTSTPSPFAGSWAGTWTSSTAQSGTVTCTIAENGNVAGTVVNDTISESAPLTGKVQNNGNVNISYTYPGSPKVNASGTWALSNGGNTITGTVVSSGFGSSDFTLTRQ